MESALIVTSRVSSAKESAAFFSEALNSASIKQITVTHSSGDAKRLILRQDFDLVIVDSPLPDELGESLSRHIASGDASQVILAVDSEDFDAVSTACEDDGVLVIAKPIERDIFYMALKFARSAQCKLRRVREENSKLRQKIEDIRIIDRAKYTLISYLGMSENEAHRFIEKQAMDMRSTKRAIAEGILKTYAN